jgi:UDP-N-acetylmuramyl pentapeptide phosphotransferase/UDP-N-acetylglucosamine-1-phosphate transferase
MVAAFAGLVGALAAGMVAAVAAAVAEGLVAVTAVGLEVVVLVVEAVADLRHVRFLSTVHTDQADCLPANVLLSAAYRQAGSTTPHRMCTHATAAAAPCSTSDAVVLTTLETTHCKRSWLRRRSRQVGRHCKDASSRSRTMCAPRTAHD